RAPLDYSSAAALLRAFSATAHDSEPGYASSHPQSIATSSEPIVVSSGTGPWHPAWKLVKLRPMGAPSQDRDAGSNPAGATTALGRWNVDDRGQHAREDWPRCTPENRPVREPPQARVFYRVRS